MLLRYTLSCASVHAHTTLPLSRSLVLFVSLVSHYWEKNAAVNQEGAFGYWKRELAHRMIDAGAHVYVAHGDPRLQGIEIYRGSPVFYCLGNFIFQTKTALGFYGEEVWQSVIVHLHCHDIAEAMSYSVKLIPIVLNEVGETEENHFQTRGLPRLASRSVGQLILLKLAKLSAPFGTTITIEDSIEGDDTSPVIGWVLGPATNQTDTTMPLVMGEIDVAADGIVDRTRTTSQATSASSISSSSIPDSGVTLLSRSQSNPDVLKVPLVRELSPQAAIFPSLENELVKLSTN
jgi:hypothetical protein